MLFARLIELYSYLIFARVIFGWFPVSRGGTMEQIYSFLYTVTEPVLGPVRRALPSGVIDFSPIVVGIGLQILAQAIAR